MEHGLQRIDNPKLSPLCSFEDVVAALRVASCARHASSFKHMVKL